MNIGELFIALGFDVDDKKLKEFKDDLKGVFESLIKVGASTAGAVYALNAFVQGSTRHAVALRDINAATGASIELTQRWANVLSLANPGETFEQATGNVKAFIDSFTQAQKLGVNSTAFGRLGIGSLDKMDWQSALVAIRQQYQKNPSLFGSKAFQAQNLSQLGLGTDFINAANLPGGQFANFYNRQVLSDDEVNNMVKFASATQDAEWQLSQFKDHMVAAASVPLAEHLATARQSIDDIKAAFAGAGDAIKPFETFLKWIAGGASALVLGFFEPLALALIGIAVAAKAIGETRQGKSNFLNSHPLLGLPHGTEVQNDLLHPVQALTRLDRFMQEFNRAQMDKVINQNITNNVHSTADPQALARQIASENQRTLNHAMAQTGNGPK